MPRRCPTPQQALTGARLGCDEALPERDRTGGVELRQLDYSKRVTDHDVGVHRHPRRW